jgi:hypothetical protein
VARFALVVLATLVLIASQAACGEEVTNVFSNVIPSLGSTPSP